LLDVIHQLIDHSTCCWTFCFIGSAAIWCHPFVVNEQPKLSAMIIKPRLNRDSSKHIVHHIIVHSYIPCTILSLSNASI